MPYNTTGGLDPTPGVYEPTGGWASETQFTTLYDRPYAYFADVVARHGSYAGFVTFLKSTGKSFSHTKNEIGHYEAPWNEDALYVGSFTGGAAAGATAVVTLHADAMYDTQASVNGTAAKGSYPTEHMVVQFTSGAQAIIKSKDTTTDPHKVTLKPKLAATILANEIVAGEKYFIVSTEFGEGTGLPPTIAPRYMKWSNTFGIVKSAWGGSITEATNEVYPKINGQTGRSIYLRLEMDYVDRMERYRDGLLLFGTQGDNLTSYNAQLGQDVKMNGTQGFATFANAYGHQDTYAAGGYTLNDLGDIAEYMDSERAAPTGQLVSLDGNKYWRAKQTAFQNTLSNNMDVFVSNDIPDLAQYSQNERDTTRAKNFGLKFGIYAVEYEAYQFVWKKMPAFSAKFKGAVNSNYEYPGLGIIFPTDTIKSKNGNMLPMVGYAYKTGADGSTPDRDLVFGSIMGVGSGAARAATQYDIKRQGLVSEIAGLWATGNRIVYQKSA